MRNIFNAPFNLFSMQLLIYCAGYKNQGCHLLYHSALSFVELIKEVPLRSQYQDKWYFLFVDDVNFTLTYFLFYTVCHKA